MCIRIHSVVFEKTVEKVHVFLTDKTTNAAFMHARNVIF